MHIGKALNIDIFGEEYQYLTGEIGLKMFKIAKRFMCEHCRKDLKVAFWQKLTYYVTHSYYDIVSGYTLVLLIISN